MRFLVDTAAGNLVRTIADASVLIGVEIAPLRRKITVVESYPLLIAEDNLDDVWLLDLALRKAQLPCRAHFVMDGEEAIDWLKGTSQYHDRNRFPLPRFLITDLKMPRTDGFGLIQWVRSNPDFSQLPILVLSSSDLAKDVERACSLGANACLRKTPHFVSVVDYLREML